MRTRVKILVGALVVGAAALGAGTAAADPVHPDPNQPANGAGVTSTLTGPLSPVQVPAPDVTTTGDTTTVTAHPFLAPWVHGAVPIDPHSEFELRGAARVTLPDPTTGGTIVVNPNGHCLFTGSEAGRASTQTPLPQVHLDVPGAAVSIEPTLRHG